MVRADLPGESGGPQRGEKVTVRIRGRAGGTGQRGDRHGAKAQCGWSRPVRALQNMIFWQVSARPGIPVSLEFP
ncbi:hypothetical protein BSLA_03r0104 [Burkholderia stabilis]|nr:hypothetical protein BSLA_03r0104 [Burkholderia stabilis]